MEDKISNLELEAYNPRGELLKFKLRESKSKCVGETLKNKSGEEFKVLGQTGIKDNWGNYSYFLIEFRDRTRLIIHISPIRRGQVKNPNFPSVYGVGYLGQGEHICSNMRKVTKEYKLWGAMLQRCYDEKHHEKNPTYKDCTVDPRWHNFQNFCDDIQSLENYDKWVEGQKDKKNPYALDKDIKVEGNKIYSKDTCVFVTAEENTLKARLTGKLYKGISPTGEEFIFDNIRQFAREHKLHHSNIRKCLSGKQKSHKGWQFKEL